MKNTIKEIYNWLEDNTLSDKEKIENIAKMLFVELSDDDKIELFDEAGADFEFYIRAVKKIDFDVYDGNCVKELTEVMNDKFLSMETFATDKILNQCNYILNKK